MTKFTILFTATACSALLLAAPVSAQDELRTEAVQFGDLDLRSDLGVKKLDYRLRSAATRVCGIGEFISLETWAQGRQCQRGSLAAVAPQRAMAIENARTRRGTVEVVSLTVKNSPARN